MKNLTIIVPAYNEEDGIALFYKALKKELEKLTPTYVCGIIFVVDGGKDRTFDVLKGVVANDKTVSVIKFSRNFGHQMALLAGIDHSSNADVLITMDSDLQHPPAVIPELLKEFEKGNEVVYTVRTHNADSGFIRRLFGTLFYKGINLISEVPINENASDFRLISGRVASLIRESISERNLFLRGIVSWVGFTQSSVRFVAQQRIAGRSKYSLSKLISFALFGVISFSKKPLRAAGVFGMFVAFGGLVFAVVTVVQYFLGDPFPPGWATVVVLLSIFGGLQLFFLGVIGEYIGGIFDEVKGRPRYIVETSVNIETL